MSTKLPKMNIPKCYEPEKSYHFLKKTMHLSKNRIFRPEIVNF